MQYQPLDLEKERAEYVERLSFFQDAFVFQYDQLHVFLKSLSDRFPANGEESSQDSDVEIEEVG